MLASSQVKDSGPQVVISSPRDEGYTIQGLGSVDAGDTIQPAGVASQGSRPPTPHNQAGSIPKWKTSELKATCVCLNICTRRVC